MNHTDHVNLLRNGIPAPGGVWADLGAGEGAFTLALAELIGPTGMIYAVDRTAGALRTLAQAMRQHFPRVALHTVTADFTAPLALPLLDSPVLDGIVLANSLHFQRQPAPVVRRLKEYLQPGGRMVVVEYDTEQGNFAVPHPISYGRWARLAQECGFAHTELLATRPSRFLRAIYAAASW
jgi:ubiquinone/menaquinone biosynthesis C-methylase UbiE